MTKKAIKHFLNTFATRVDETPDNDAEFWMDDHVCIKWGGIEYYIPEDNMLYGEEESRIVEHLEEKYHI